MFMICHGTAAVRSEGRKFSTLTETVTLSVVDKDPKVSCRTQVTAFRLMLDGCLCEFQ